jgi:TPP-dependent 2-oxoacid decarboxylase
MVATTCGVGELSALNGVMGAKAERSLVFHVVGMPSYQNQRLSKIVPSHPWRRQFREFRRPLSRGGLLLRHHQSG